MARNHRLAIPVGVGYIHDDGEGHVTMSGHYKYEVTYALPGPRLVKWLFFAVDDEAARCYAVEHGEREWPDGEVVELKCQGRWEPTTGVPALD